MPTIRDEADGDAAAIAALTNRAFAAVEHGHGTEGAIVDGLRAAGALTVSLVATDGARITGHIAISPVLIDGRDCGWFGIGPLSVDPDIQQAGIGKALVGTALERLRAMGAAGCVVLGQPGYYGRFGFVSDPQLRYRGEASPYLQQLPFGIATAQGEAVYHPAFDGA